MLKSLRSFEEEPVRRNSFPPEGSDSPPQPVILEGGRHETARREALEIAAVWMGERRKVLEGLHVDVSVLDCGPDAMIKVDDIRAIRRDSLLRPFDGEVKVYIIDHAHKLNPNAQNALLRILEEPPHYVRFILLANSADMLLATIRSRCAVVRAAVEEKMAEDGDGAAARAEEFIVALGDPWKRAEIAFSWEKLPRDALRAVLIRLLASLRDACAREGPEPVYLKTIKTVLGLLPSLELNASVGTVCGVLAADN
jgi:DNA polymerase-3 subunit delta'